MKKLILAILFVFNIFNISCQKKKIDENTIIIGTIAGPETELVEVAKDVALNKYNLKIEILPFNDYVEPNRALADGEINANMFQHKPYLDEVVASQKWPLVNMGALYIYPMGAYSNKYKDIKQLPNKAVIAVPNDVTNQARSLLLLQKAGLIKLNSDNLTEISVHNIKDNPKNLIFKEVDPAFMARMLDDVDLALINTNYAAIVGLLPSRDALISEDKDSKYANILVVNKIDADKQKFKNLLDALRSDEVQNKAKELFKNQAIVAW